MFKINLDMYMSLLKSASKNSIGSSDIIHKSPLNKVESRVQIAVANKNTGHINIEAAQL